MSRLREICGLWRRAAFGARPTDLRRSLRAGYDATVRELVDGAAGPPDVPPAPSYVTDLPAGARGGMLQIAAVMRWWLDGMAATSTPLREKLVLFWHGHFTVSADPVFSSGLLLRNNQTLRAHAAGRFEDLLHAVVHDPGMQRYLDGSGSGADHPNENLARELLELFTLGRGHYRERDVREGARALTGFGPDGFDAQRHDSGPKRFLGHVGQLGPDDLVRILARHPQTARHVTARLYRFFTDQAPPPAEANRLSAVFTRHHGTLLPVVDALLRGQAFRESLQRREAVRSPVELSVAALRAVDRAVPDLSWVQAVHAMGQVPFLPPSVKGWDGGEAWINTATLVRRVELAARAAGLAEVAGLERPDPRLAARHVLWQLGIPDAAPATRAALSRAWDGDWRRLFALGMASPDFQVR